MTDDSILYNDAGFSVINPKPETGREWLVRNCVQFQDTCGGIFYIFTDQAIEKIAEAINMETITS